MDLGTRCLHLLCRLKCSLNLSSEQRRVSSDFLITKAFGPKILVCLVKNLFMADQILLVDTPTPALLVHWSYRERNTHAMLYKCGAVRRLKRGKSGLQIIALTGGPDLYLNSSLTNNGKNGKLFLTLFLFCFLFPFIFYKKHDVNIN